MAKSNDTYWGAIVDAFRSLSEGLSITFRQLLGARKTRPVLSISDPQYFTRQEGIATIQYPHVMLPVPDNGRYRLHNEIDDCIVCDKCAKICPVNCIEIEAVKATEEIGKTSDGTSKRIYAAKFDIDMAKCCFCGLRTTVCPTECLTMTKVFDFSVTDIKEHNFAFAEMTPDEIADKKRVLEEHQKSKIAAVPPTPPVQQVQPATPPTDSPEAKPQTPAKPVFKPRIKPPGTTPPATS